MPRAADQGVQESGAITGIAARQNVGRVSRPKEDTLAPEIGTPGFVDARSVGEQPSPGEGLADARAFLPRCRGRQVPKPGKSLHPVRDRIAGAEASEIELVERQDLVAKDVASGKHCITALAVALHVVARNRDELERLAP